MTKRLLDAALNLQEFLVEANSRRGAPRMARLDQADAELDKLRLYLRMADRWHWVTAKQYQYAAERTTEIGALLGGWKKITRQTAAR